MMQTSYDQKVALLALIEVMEIKPRGNVHIEALQRTAYEEIQKMLEGASAHWLFSVITEARQKVRDELSGFPNRQ